MYFYNERGKHSKFLFLAMTSLVTERINNNDPTFFDKFTVARARLEKFLIENKPLIGILLQNTAKEQRVPRIRQMLNFLITTLQPDGAEVTTQQMIENLGVKTRVFEVTTGSGPTHFSDDSKSAIFISQSIHLAPKCPQCGGLLFAKNSVTYDHIERVRDGGTGAPENGQMMHPYCNSSVRN